MAGSNSDSRSQVQGVPAAARIASDLRGRMLALELYPGTPLREADLASRYGVSRYTVRSALQLLASEGLVEHVPHRGAAIRSVTAEDLRDVFGYREILENGAIRRICRDGLDISRFADAVAALEQEEEAVLAGRLQSYQTAAADIDTHKTLVRCAESPRLLRAYEALQAEILLCFALYGIVGLPVIEHEHRDVLEAIEQHDESAAQAALSTMLWASHAHLLAQWSARTAH